MSTPIDDLIEHLKGSTPYGKTEAIKLWEALKTLSDSAKQTQLNSDYIDLLKTIITPLNPSSSGGGLASQFGNSFGKVVIDGECFQTTNNYDQSYYGALAVREYMTIFSQRTCF